MSRPGPLDHTVAAALGRSEALTGLMQRLRESRARLEILAPHLPPALAGEVRAGPLDENAFVLLVAHAAAAAKLRQMLPLLESTLRSHGRPGPPIKIKVLPRA